MRNTVRTFVAVEIPSELQMRARKLVEHLQGTPANVKWVAPVDMHWTFKFLGEVDLVEVPEICERVAKGAAQIAPFDVEAYGAGAFPDPYNARTVWLGVREGFNEMIALHDTIERELSGMGFRTEHRRFRPHITLGRVRRSDEGQHELGELIKAQADFDGGISTVYEVVVFSSQLGPKGPTYEPLGHAPLG